MNKLQDIFSKLAPVRLMNASLQDFVMIDISKNNPALGKFDVSSSKEWEIYLDSYLKDSNAKIAYGGYLEVRDIYSRSTYFKDTTSKERNIHLGIDLWTKAGTPVFVPLDGSVHSFRNNTNHGDYGPTVIMEHMIDDVEFYTLYGHLSLESLKGLEVGSEVMQGEVLGYLGDASVNGDYAPHLHFQVIVNLENYIGDYPGVCANNELGFYKENCPDPNLLLKLPA